MKNVSTLTRPTISSAALFIFVVCLFGISASKAEAATRVVDNLSDNFMLAGCTAAPNDCSLRGAVEFAGLGDTIGFDISGVITLGSRLFIRRELMILGPGAAQLTVRGGFTIEPLPGSPTVRPRVKIDGLTISNSFAGSAGPGGGAINNDGILRLTNVFITGNLASGNGGGILNGLNGDLNLANSTVYANAAATGGGIYNDGTATITNSTFSLNVSTGHGGAIFSSDSATTTINNSTVFNNRADSDGLLVETSGGIRAGGNVVLRNTIVAGNLRGTGTTSDDIGDAGITEARHNLIGDAASAGGVVNGADGNIVGVDADTVLDTTLANNGGPTLTYALLDTSPARDAGSNAILPADALDLDNDGTISEPLPVDQRGPTFLRRSNTTVDIGAYEYFVTGGGPVSTLPGPDGDGDGVPDSRDNCPAISNPGKMTFTSYREFTYDIFVMNVDGTNPVNLSSDDAINTQSEISPNGTKIVFVKGSDIHLMNIDGSGETPITFAPFSESEPTWSPDGSKIAFTSNSAGFYREIFVMNSDGTNHVNLTNNSSDDSLPAFSPDGSKIVFISKRDGGNEIYVMNADGTGQTRITDNATSETDPAFSPDGSKIVFSSLRAGNSDIYVMNVDGTGEMRLTDDPAFDIYPAFSPNADKIAFVSFRDGNEEIYVMNADGTNEVNLTNEMQDDEWPMYGGQLDSDSDGVGDACEGDNSAPAAVADTYGTNEDTPLNVPALGVLSNDTDPDSNPLSAVLVSGPSNSQSFVLNANGSFSYTPATNFSGSDSFTYKSNDGSLDSEAAIVTITVDAVNDPPVADDDDYAVSENAILVVPAATGVLQGDTDVDGGALAVITNTAPAHGSVVSNADGSFSYTPHTNFFGSDSFTYTVGDGGSGFDTGLVTITVNEVLNDPPAAANDSYSVVEDGMLAPGAMSGVLANDSDPQNDPLNAVVVTGPSNGSLTLNPDGSFVYTPSANFSGSDSFTYKANDGSLDSNVATVVIAVHPDTDGDGIPDLTDNCVSTPNRYKMALVTGNSEIYVMNSDGSGQTGLTNNTVIDTVPAFSPDGLKIAFTSHRDGNFEIYVMNSDGSSPTRLTNNAVADSDPAFSPDGSKIIFTSNRDGNEEIYVMNADGTGQSNLTNHASHDRHPSFSHDGSKIVFDSGRDDSFEIYAMNSDGSNQTRLTNDAAFDRDPAFSPDGSRITFVSDRDGNDEIYVMNSNGTGQTNLTANTADDREPTFSPDGSKIAFSSIRDAINYSVYVMNADGSNPTRLTNNAGFTGAPSWGPQLDSDGDGIGDACDGVSNVTSNIANGTYGFGTNIDIQVTFGENVTVTGTPQLTLETGASNALANYLVGSGTNTLTFRYVVAAGHATADLDYVSASSLSLNGGTIKDSASNNMSLLLPAPGAAHSLGGNKDIAIETIAPLVTFINRANGNPTNLASVTWQVVFSEPVTGVDAADFTLTNTGISGASIAGVSHVVGSTWNVTANTGTGSGTIRLNLSDNDSIQDAATNRLGGFGINNGNFNGEVYTIDKTPPTVINVSSSKLDGVYTVGEPILIQVLFSENVIISGTPQLTLETGATDAIANYVGDTGTNVLTFVYIVGPGHTSADLDYVSTSSLSPNGGTIRDAVGNNANLILPQPGLAGVSLGGSKNIVIDTTPPAVVSLNRQTASPTNAAGLVWQIKFSEPVNGVDVADFSLATSGISAASIISVSNPNPTTPSDTWNISVDSGNGSGVIGLNLNDDDSIRDVATNGLGGTGPGNGSFTGQVYAVDRTLVPVITVNSRDYNGNTSATIATRTFTSAIVPFGTHAVSVTGGTANFVDPNAGMGKTVNVTGLSLSGADAARFVLSSTTATATASIFKAAVTATAGGGSGVYSGFVQSPMSCQVTGAYTGSLNCVNNPSVVGPGVGMFTIAPLIGGDNLANFNVAYVSGSYTIQPALTGILPDTNVDGINNDCINHTYTATLKDTSNNTPLSGISLKMTIGTQSATATTNASGVATFTLILFQAPGTVTQKFELNQAWIDPNRVAPSLISRSFTVGGDPSVGPGTDADSLYTGSLFFWTTSPSSSNATLTLSATLKDAFELCPTGDITKAKVSFFISSNGGGSFSPVSNAQNLPVGLVNPNEPNVGTASAISSYNIGSSQSVTLIVRVVVGGYYNLSDSTYDIPITIGKAGTANSLMGGGKLKNDGSPFNASGYFGINSISSTFGSQVTYNKKGTSPQGQVTVYVRSCNLPTGAVDPACVPSNPSTHHVYFIKSNSISELSLIGGSASFGSKTNVSKMLADGTKITLDGGNLMQLLFTPYGMPLPPNNAGNPIGTTCTFSGGCASIVIYRSTGIGGGVWYSSSWGQPPSRPAQTWLKKVVNGTVAVQ